MSDSLAKITEYLATRQYSSEVIVVDDGSTDRTALIVQDMADEDDRVHLVQAVHGGKGHACKQGVLASHGDWIFLCDADLSMPIAELSKFTDRFNDNQPILIGSREVVGASRIDEPDHRHLMGRGFNWLVRSIAVKGIEDTQCGFKCFRRDVALNVFSLQTIPGWGFDVEVLFIARKHGYPVIEIPITWQYQEHSKVRPVVDAVKMLREVCQVRLNDWRGRY